MWDHLPLDALQPDPVCEPCMGRYANMGRRKDGIGQALDRLVAEKVLRGWSPLTIETDLGDARHWKITPTEGPGLTYDRVGIEAFLRMVDDGAKIRAAAWPVA